MASQFYARYIPPILPPSLATTKGGESSKLKRKSEDPESSQAAPSTHSKKRKRGKPKEKFGPAAVDGAGHVHNVDGAVDDVVVEINGREANQEKRASRKGIKDVESVRETSNAVEQGNNGHLFPPESGEVKKRKHRKADGALDHPSGINKGVRGEKIKARILVVTGKAGNGRKAKKGQNPGDDGAEDNAAVGTADYVKPVGKNKAREGGTQAKPKGDKKELNDAFEHGDEGEGHTDSEWEVNQRLGQSKPKEQRALSNLSKSEKTKQKSKAREEDPPSEVTESDGDIEGDAKYKSILSKFQRSTQISETLVKESSSGTNDDLQNQEQFELQGLVPLPQPEQVPDSTSKPAFSTLPSWLAHPITVSSNSVTPFRDLQLSAKLTSSLESKGYRDAFAIQSAVLPMLLPGPTQHMGDLCISAATGSGKTLAYVLPMVESLRHRTFTRLRGLIVVPTRELVTQAREVCELCSAGTNLSVGVAMGNRALKTERDLLIKRGQKYDPQAYKELQRIAADAESDLDYDYYGESDPEDNFVTLPEHVASYTSKVDILICTPGRLVDHIRTTPGFTLEDLQWLVIDEADRLLDQSFQGWIDVVLKALEDMREYGQMKAHEQILMDMGLPLPKRNTRKIILSATMTRDIGKLSALKLRKPKLIVVDGHGSTRSKSGAEEGEAESQDEAEQTDAFGLPPTLKEWAIAAGDGNEKPLYLLQLLQMKILVGGGWDDPITCTTSKEVSSPDGQGETTPSEDCISDDESESVLNDALSPPASASARDPGSADDSRSDPTSPSAEVKKPRNTGCGKTKKTGGVLIFTKSNESATRLSRLISLLNPSLASRIGTLTGSIPSCARRKMLAAFRTNKLPILLASDLVARGLDVDNIAHIVNYDLPKGTKGYVHRVGRTARAGRKGEAWTLITETEARWFWKAIGGGARVRRSGGQKVVRVRLDIDALGLEGRRRYEEALNTLKAEVRGGMSVR